jgi:hypothetical protein
MDTCFRTKKDNSGKPLGSFNLTVRLAITHAASPGANARGIARR